VRSIFFWLPLGNGTTLTSSTTRIGEQTSFHFLDGMRSFQLLCLRGQLHPNSSSLFVAMKRDGFRGALGREGGEADMAMCDEWQRRHGLR
jgi:hypothetical protein